MKKTKMLKKNYEFRRVLSKGKYTRGNCLEIYILSNNKLKVNEIGIAIGKKVGKSVERNMVKRLIRENYRLIEEHLKIGYSMVFLWNKKVPIQEANFYKIKEDMNIIFAREGILEK